MKYIVIVPDGAADYPQESLGGKTPFEVADLVNIHALTSQGVIGRVLTVPKGFSPASDVANLSILGYDPRTHYTGRAPLEAANMGITLAQGDVAFRCNLITEVDGKVFDYSAGHISTKEAGILIQNLDIQLGTEEVKFYPGVSYRHLVVVKGGVEKKLDTLKCFPPHDITGQLVKKNLPSGKGSQFIIDLMERSRSVLAKNEINTVRVDLHENPANMIWLWGQGVQSKMETFQSKFGIDGAVISAVDLIKGLGKTIGFRVLSVENATGYYDTNYLGKAQAALAALEEVDFVYVHIEATDEAGHNKDLRMKIACLERIDKLVVGTILNKIDLADTRILVVPDHFTPVSVGTHTSEPVPFLMAGAGIPKSLSGRFSEEDAAQSNLFFEDATQLMSYFIKYGNTP